MKISPREAWIIARLLCGRSTAPDGQIEPLDESDRIFPLADQLRATELKLRTSIWKGFLAAQADRDDWTAPVGDAIPTDPPPPEDPRPALRRRADLGSIKRLMADTVWPWPGWLAGGVLNTLASNPGEGKTILAMNLARILWEGLPWPDGSPNRMPAKTRTLWIPGDRHYNQLIDLAERYGLPDEALLFNAPSDDPTNHHDLDEPGVLDDLESAIEAESPGLVIVDTVGMTTRRSLGRPEEAREYFSPLMDIAMSSKVSFLLVTHLSKDSQALGRRIVGASRVVWKLTKPDPEHQPDRRKLWGDKTYIVAPKPLGMTISDDGCTFDNRPPETPSEA